MDTNYLVSGAVYGTTLTLIAIAAPRFTRALLAATLVVAAVFYVWFALDAHTNAAWVAVELVGIGIYGYAAMRGVRGSAWWLVAGLALHPIWDVAIHYAGPGHAFAPEWYTTWCLTYDLMAAALTALAILIGTHLTDAPGVTPATASAIRLRTSTCTCDPTCTCGSACTCTATMGACAA
jgi:hypothetical protein